MARPKITKITVEIEGKGPVEIDPANIDALFFTEQGVKNILVPYYNSTSSATMSGAEVENKWDTPDPGTGELLAMLKKRPDCTVE